MADVVGPIQIKRGTSTEWANANVALREGEFGFDTTRNRIKVGDGSSLWSGLPWVSNDAATIARLESLSAEIDDAVTPNNVLVAAALKKPGGPSEGALFDAINGRAVSKGAQVVDVRDYGAVGNGVTDDTAAIRAAVAAAGSRGTVVFPTGRTFIIKSDSTYAHGFKPRPGQKILGNGAVLRAASNAPVGIRVIAVEEDDVTIEGLVIDQAGIDQSTGVYVTSAEGLLVKGCRFPSPRSGALHVVSDVYNLAFTGNTVSGGGYGVLVADPQNVRGLVISGNVFDGHGELGDGIELNVPSKGAVSVVSITSNTIRGYVKTSTNANTGFGIAVAGVSQVSIVGNVVSNCGRNGIHVEDASGEITVVGNTIRSCGDAGIEIQPTPSGIGTVLVSGNTVRDCCINVTTNVPNLGKGNIQVGWENAGVGSANDVTVSGNIVYGSSVAGIFAYQAPGVQIVGNRCFNNATNGIELWSCTGAIVQGNRCYDSRSTKVQAYGLRISSGQADKLLVVGNNFDGNLTGGVSDVTAGAVFAMNVGAESRDAIVISGGTRRLGFYGTAAIAKPTGVPAAATDAATTQALVNDLRAKLITLGLIGS